MDESVEIMRCIIMCDGKSSRWYANIYESYWGSRHKQLVEVDGVPILHRTVSLLKERGMEDIWITSHIAEHEIEGAKRYAPPDNAYEIDKFYSPIHLWEREGTTLFVYGDVYFTEDAMNRIVNIDVDDFLFFGRFHLSSFTCHGGEIFAVKVKDHAFFKDSCFYIRCLYEAGLSRCGAWELYRLMNGAPDKDLGVHIPYGHFVGIDDWTDDFDTPSHFENWLQLYEGGK